MRTVFTKWLDIVSQDELLHSCASDSLCWCTVVCVWCVSRCTVTTRHVTRASGCTGTVSVSGRRRCWHTWGQVVGLEAGVRSSVCRICGQRKATTWRLRHVTASVAVVTCDRWVVLCFD